MKESHKGLVAVAVFVAILYLSKKDAYSDMRWGGAMYPNQSNISENAASQKTPGLLKHTWLSGVELQGRSELQDFLRLW